MTAGVSSAPTTPDPVALLARIERLEAERRRAFDDAQREADALFAQYQLSQLIASGGSPGELGTAVLLELIRLADADGGALWLGRSDRAGLDLVAAAGDGGVVGDPPPHLAALDPARAWAAAMPAARVVVLSETAPLTVLAVWPRPGTAIDEEGLRIAQLARHELTVAFQGARLREALEQERQELGAIVDGATDLILQVDGERRIVRLNPAGARLLGIDGDAAVGRSCADVLGCEIAGGHGEPACPLAEVCVSAVPIAYRESAIRGASGVPVRVAGSYAATPAAGRDVRATAILRDISAVQALQELREGFVATVSHELRTPLALIRGYAESILHLELSPDQQRVYVARIDEATGRLTALVDEVLDVTHLQADPLILERRPTAFAALIGRLRGDLEASGGADRLVVATPADLPEVDVDVARIAQVLSNLVGNAIKYAPDGTPITIVASVTGDVLEVAVDDQGVGVPEAERGLVTEPFHRAWNVRESRIPGTGLGLFICRRLVEAHGGRLTVGDRPDGRDGTRVTFTLPLAADDGADA